nr:MAG TPA: hypothetical protein [Caudoviricetes sp.]
MRIPIPSCEDARNLYFFMLSALSLACMSVKTTSFRREWLSQIR